MEENWKVDEKAMDGRAVEKVKETALKRQQVKKIADIETAKDHEYHHDQQQEQQQHGNMMRSVGCITWETLRVFSQHEVHINLRSTWTAELRTHHTQNMIQYFHITTTTAHTYFFIQRRIFVLGNTHVILLSFSSNNS